jgi:hypothetical protein
MTKKSFTDNARLCSKNSAAKLRRFQKRVRRRARRRAADAEAFEKTSGAWGLA